MLKAQVQATLSERLQNKKKNIRKLQRLIHQRGMFCTGYVLVTNYKQPLLYHHLARQKNRPAENQVIEFNRATVNRGGINLGKPHTVLQSILTAPITSGIPSIWRKSVLIVASRSLAYCSPGVTANRGDSV